MRVIVKQSNLFPPHSGALGLFACTAVEINTEIVMMRTNRLLKFPSRKKWIIVAGNKDKPEDGAIQIGSSYITDWARTSVSPQKWYYINHSHVNANVAMRKYKSTIVWIAITAIHIGDEFKFDYGIVPDDYVP